MKRMSSTQRARGSNRGGCGGGFEPTNPDYDAQKLQRLRADYLATDPQWQPTFLSGLSKYEQKFVTGKIDGLTL